MNKKIVFGTVIGVGVLIILGMVSSGSPKSSEVVDNQLTKNNTSLACGPQQSCSGTDKVEVFLFHATQRCPTCISIGRLARATIEERFSEQLKLGEIDFREINIDLPENKALAAKFQAGGSALYINSIKNGQDNIKEDTMVWQLAGGTADNFKDYLSNKLNGLMGI